MTNFNSMKNVILILLVTGITNPAFSQTLKPVRTDSTLEYSLIFKKNFTFDYLGYHTLGFTNSKFFASNFDLSISGKSKIITMSQGQYTGSNNYRSRVPCIKSRYDSKMPCLKPEFVPYMTVFNSVPNWEYYLIMDAE